MERRLSYWLSTLDRQPDLEELAYMVERAKELEALDAALSQWEGILARPPGGAEGDTTPMSAGDLAECLRNAARWRR